MCVSVQMIKWISQIIFGKLVCGLIIWAEIEI